MAITVICPKCGESMEESFSAFNEMIIFDLDCPPCDVRLKRYYPFNHQKQVSLNEEAERLRGQIKEMRGT